MADFNISYAKTKALEGVNGKDVYALLKSDDGGETYGGLARKFNPSFPAWHILDAEKIKRGGKIPNNTNIPALDPFIKEYYRVNYWNKKAQGDKIKNQDVANLVFDMVVNHGAGGKLINEAVKNAGYKIAINNTVTSDTLNALNSEPARIYPYIYKRRESYFRGDSDFPSFGKGWLNRLHKFPSVIQSAGAIGLVLILIILTVVVMNSGAKL